MDTATATPATSGTSPTDLFNTGLNPLITLWDQFVHYIPQLLAALIILIIGWIVASVVGMVVRRLVRFSGLDKLVTRHGINDRLNIAAGSRYALASNMIGTIVKWILILGALGIACDILNLGQVNIFIGTVLGYIPNVIVAILILTVGMVAAQFVYEILRTALSSADLPVNNTDMLAAIAKYAIIVFAVMAALTQLGIVPQLIQIMFAGIVAALALAFGLGGREHASQFIGKLRERA